MGDGWLLYTTAVFFCRTLRTKMNFTQVGIATVALFVGSAYADVCPPAGERYTIKGFTGNTEVVAKGVPYTRKLGCSWKTLDGRDLQWDMGPDVVRAAPLAAAPAQANAKSGAWSAPTAGQVYRCTLPGIGMFTGAYFGIVDGTTYRNYDGKTGRYTFDAASGVLRLNSGASRGLSYKRETATVFRVLDDNGKITGGSCIYNPELRIDGRW
jgi:hypothetical protein